MPPTFVLRRRESDVQKWPPLRSLWPANQRHLRFLRKPVALARVTRDARTNDILPRRRAAAIARQDVIEVQLNAIENVAAILAGVLVALENVVPGELHFLLRQPIEEQKNDHARDANLPRNGGYDFVLRRGRREIAPALEIMRQKIVRFIRGNDLGVAGINQRERAPRRADVDRLPEAIQHQNLTI